MFRFAFVVAVIITAPCAMAAEPQYLSQSTGLSNDLSVGVLGDLNFLQISQDHFGGLAANTMALSITGDRNGGPAGRAFTGPLADQSLVPGTLSQSGSGNDMTVVVNGSDNLFSFVQTGNGNSLTASISGTANQAIVNQVGDGNTVGFSQNGIGNLLLISQQSW